MMIIVKDYDEGVNVKVIYFIISGIQEFSFVFKINNVIGVVVIIVGDFDREKNLVYIF